MDQKRNTTHRQKCLVVLNEGILHLTEHQAVVQRQQTTEKALVVARHSGVSATEGRTCENKVLSNNTRGKWYHSHQLSALKQTR
jgi:hypothetical protein